MARLKTIMFKSLLYIGLFVAYSTTIIYAQTNCSKDKLLGTWMRADIYLYPKDTLTKKNLNILLSDSIKDKGWGWTFDSSEKRTSLPEKKVVTYRIDEKGCKIIYGHRKNPSRLQATYILYLDDKYLVLQIPNRHSHTTACFRKK